MSESSRSVVIISTHVALFERLIANAGFSVAGAADLTINGEQLVELFQPSIVLFDSDLPGEQDLAAVARIRQAAPLARILMVCGRIDPFSNARSLGVDAMLARDDLLELGSLLRELEALPPRSPDSQERRSGRDRRQVQDWSKIGFEYRRQDRRADDRQENPQPV